MQNNDLENKKPQIRETEEGFDWAAMLVKVLREYKFIIIVTLLFTILGVAMNWNRKRFYTVSVELAPEMKARTSNTVSSLARLMGYSGSAGSGDDNDALNVTLFPDICASNPFLLRLLDVQVNTLKGDFYGKPSVSLFKYVTTPKDSASIFTKVMGGIMSALSKPSNSDELKMLSGKKGLKNTAFRMDRKHLMAVKMLRASISAECDKKTAITTITVKMDDPLIAATLADTVCARLQCYIVEYRTRKAKNDLEYYQKLENEAKAKYIQAQQAYAACVDYDQSAILQSVKSEKERMQAEANVANQIYLQMRQQTENCKAKIQEAKPVFAVVQPATVPTKPSGHGRKYYVFLYFAFGLAASIGWVIYGKDFYAGMKKQIKEKMNEAETSAESKENEEETSETQYNA